jgi:hypothetical protein
VDAVKLGCIPVHKAPSATIRDLPTPTRRHLGNLGSPSLQLTEYTNKFSRAKWVEETKIR